MNDENPGFQPLARTVEMELGATLAAIPANYLPPLRMELNGCAARTRAGGLIWTELEAPFVPTGQKAARPGWG